MFKKIMAKVYLVLDAMTLSYFIDAIIDSGFISDCIHHMDAEVLNEMFMMITVVSALVISAVKVARFLLTKFSNKNSKTNETKKYPIAPELKASK